jgi:lipopolysaccharide heptosyltransferase II
MSETKKVVKKLYLNLRLAIFSLLALCTFSLRKKRFSGESARRVLVIALHRIGDAVVSIPTFRAIKESLPGSRMTVFANSYVKEILERIDDVDEIAPYDKDSSWLEKARLIRKLSRQRFDLAVDLTCDYTFEGAFLAFLSRAKYSAGYNTYGRAFLLHKPVRHKAQPIHVVDEILNIVRSIGLDTQDKSLRISASPQAIKTIRDSLRAENVKDSDLLVGIHPGGYYPSQRWPEERFAEVADKITEEYKARIILIGGSKEEYLVRSMEKIMKNKPLIFLNQPVKNLLALIQSCRLLICNNSGPLHIAAALGIPTVSTIGPTIPQRWWPYGPGHIVIHKDLPCMPCNEGSCRLKTLDCLKRITVDDMLDGVRLHLSKIRREQDS